MSSTSAAPLEIREGALVTTDEAARLIGVASQSLRAWRIRNCGPAFIKQGRNVRYHLDDINVWLNRNRFETSNS